MLQPFSALRLLAALAAAGLWACAGLLPGSRSSGDGSREAGHADRVEASAPLTPASKEFAPPTELDRMLDARPHALPAVKPAAPAADVSLREAKGAAPEAAGATFRIQVDALSDVDAAQARKAVLEGRLGMRVDMIFDAPYFKLRVGNFATRQEAEDKLLDLAGKNVQGFIVRQ